MGQYFVVSTEINFSQLPKSKFFSKFILFNKFELSGSFIRPPRPFMYNIYFSNKVILRGHYIDLVILYISVSLFNTAPKGVINGNN